MPGWHTIFRPRIVMSLAAVLLCWGLLRSYPLGGDEQAVALAAGQADDADAADHDEPKGDPTKYELPKSDSVDDLMTFIERINTFRPRSSAQLKMHRKLAPSAIKAAAERILKVEKDKSSQAYRTAKALLLAVRASTLSQSTPAEQQALIDEVAERLSGGEPAREDLGIAMLITRNLEQSDDARAAATANRRFGAALRGSKNKEIATLAEHFDGTARRYELIGKPIKVDGQTVAEKPFDWQDYRGKVVLVDFFATWCGPCREEVPNVKRAYRVYHDRGFDVVGVSIDDDDEALDKFVAEEKPPWVTLRDKPKGKAVSDHPLADYYGISAIPTVILVGKDGNVVSLHARGKELWSLLSELLGPAGKTPLDEEASDDATSKPDAPKADATAF